MNLFIDVGNTRIKWVLVGANKSLQEGHIPLEQVDELATIWHKLKKPSQIFGSNVASRLIGYQLENITQTCFAQSIYWLTVTNPCCGVTHFCEPENGKITLGTDRWAALIAAHHRYQDNMVVVGLGTAMVVEALTAQGEFLGGMILPGIRAMQLALQTTTARVDVSGGHYAPFPCTTDEAVYTGIVTALSSAVDNMVQRLALHAGKKEVRCILTGGDTALIAPYLQSAFIVKENLVLEGLMLLAKEADAAVWQLLGQSADGLIKTGL